MRAVLTNLSNRLYEESRNRLNASAARFGIRELRSYDIEDIRSGEFYRQNSDILDVATGMGYWLWKPHIILEALKSVSDDDIVIYSDSGIEIIGSLTPLLEICSAGNDVLLFGNGNNTNSMWTKRDCFILMGCDSEYYWKAPQVDAAFAMFRKTAATLDLVREWLEWCRDARILTDQPNTCGRRDLPGFIEHRRDQSVLSLLVQKHRLPLFRMPTQFGNHYKMAAYRLETEFNCINQYRPAPVGYYAVIPYYNSPYFQLLDHHRSKAKGGPPAGRQQPLVVRALRKRWRRLVNTFSLWRES